MIAWTEFVAELYVDENERAEIDKKLENEWSSKEEWIKTQSG